MTIEPRAPINTRQIVSPSSWTEAITKWGIRWEWSFPVLRAYEFSPFPEARRILPKTYAALGNLKMLGRCAPIEPDELAALLDQDVVLKPLRLQEAVQRAALLNADDPDVGKALSTIAMGIQQRIAQSEQERTGRSPQRSGPNLGDLMIALNAMWASQSGLCALCGGPIVINATNRLLRLSPDRIDSANKSYAPENLHLTHFGCNLAKNDCALEHWDEFLSVLRAQ